MNKVVVDRLASKLGIQIPYDGRPPLRAEILDMIVRDVTGDSAYASQDRYANNLPKKEVFRMIAHRLQIEGDIRRMKRGPLIDAIVKNVLQEQPHASSTKYGVQIPLGGAFEESGVSADQVQKAACQLSRHGRVAGGGLVAAPGSLDQHVRRGMLGKRSVSVPSSGRRHLACSIAAPDRRIRASELRRSRSTGEGPEFFVHRENVRGPVSTDSQRFAETETSGGRRASASESSDPVGHGRPSRENEIRMPGSRSACVRPVVEYREAEQRDICPTGKKRKISGRHLSEKQVNTKRVVPCGKFVPSRRFMSQTDDVKGTYFNNAYEEWMKDHEKSIAGQLSQDK